jgi:hypothetical protein
MLRRLLEEAASAVDGTKPAFRDVHSFAALGARADMVTTAWKMANEKLLDRETEPGR